MATAHPLLATKLYIPRPQRGVVPRARLLDRLNLGAQSKLTLLSAPAGFGKTTLLAEWLAMPAARSGVAWLSLDDSDNQAPAFWQHLIAALQSAAPEVGERALALMEPPQQPISVVLASLLNDLTAVAIDINIVLDDYHVVNAHDLTDGMAFLVEHLPRNVHLVIATRADPALLLARLRARGELVEIRAADLRFTPDEAADYFNRVMGLAVTGQDVAALEARTEGWIAALQLAALSMQGRDDISGFIASFAGDDRYIVDYLIEEVLGRQPDPVRSFLLDTSILDRLSGPLCDAVTGLIASRAMLEALDRGNLFLVPLDDRRRWYRYHHLFADMLRARLLDEQPGRVPGLHQRASAWYEQNGDRSEAIRHAMAGEDFERAADLVELATPTMQQTRQETILRRWFQALPERLFPVRPVLSIGYVGALMATGELDGVEARLRDAERWLGATSEGAGGGSTSMVVVDEARFRSLPGSIAVYRAAQALILGDPAGAMTHARRALGLVGADDHLEHGSAASLLGLAFWRTGDLEAAYRWYAEGMTSLEKGGHGVDVVGGAVTLADIRIAQGRLRDAMTIYERGLQRAIEPGPPVLRGAADMHVGLSELFREHNDLDAARWHLRTAREFGEDNGFPQHPHRWRIATARLFEAEGNVRGCLKLLDEAERLYNGDFSPNVRPIAALKARVWIAHGRLNEAVDWAREQCLSVDDDLTYLREFEHITLARLLLAIGSTAEASELLERLLGATEHGKRTGIAIEILVLLALAHARERDVAAALGPLRRALTLAEPEGYVRVFIDEGPPMSALLHEAAAEALTRSYVRHLLSAFGKAEPGAPVNRGMAEPLSERELDVLRLLGSDLNGPDIARELVLSLHTVRSHTKSIYAKLGVNNRRAAVRRAEELDLLARSRS